MSKQHTLRTISPNAAPALLLVTTLLIAACGDSKRGAARADPAGSTPRDCIDVRGSYSLATASDAGDHFELASTFLAIDAPRSADKPWQTLGIDGNADTALVLTFARPYRGAAPPGDKSVPAYIRQAMETPATQTVEKHTATVQRGVHYECKGGWLVGPPGASVRREADGDLVGRLEIRQARVIPLWAETGAGIPYWFDTTVRQSRWSAVGASAIGRAAPRTMSRLEKQEHDLEYGTAGGATAGRAASDAPYDVNKALLALVDRDAIVEKISQEGGRYVVTLRVESRGQVSRTIENLRADAHTQDVQDHGLISGGNQRDIATISLRIVAPR